ncbi:ComF family protein [Bacillus testis]|uniref:ComF family protein n=1 Tax=Bacillus testis TaxID=1622072 RepID=UPI00067F0357|nr:ComF family protein [Bacillus testis]
MFKSNLCLYCSTPMMASYSWATFSWSYQKPLLCTSCEGKLAPISGTTCSICSRELPTAEVLCQDCSRWEQDGRWKGILGKNTSLYHYNDFMKELIALYKYRGDTALAEVFAGPLKKCLSVYKEALIVPIPLSDERLMERGFNQSEQLILKAGCKPVHLLARIHSEKQSKKTRRQRLELPQIFQFKSSSPIEGKQIVLVDDIYTTGSTLRHAAEILLESGASSVHSLTVAR